MSVCVSVCLCSFRLHPIIIHDIITLLPFGPLALSHCADDDNVYDDRLFEEIFHVHTIGLFPVGFSGQRRAEFPYIVDGKVAASLPLSSVCLSVTPFRLSNL